ncbi:MAG TPA: hypothetical protein VGC86_17055 [Afipia sp.]
MHQRTFTLAWAALGVAASFSAYMPAYGADDCLSGPTGATPAGQHWYYRIERTTKKHCWYLGDHGARVNKVAAAKPDTATAIGTQETQAAPLEDSVANARAELSSPNVLSSANRTSPSSPVAIPGPEPESDASPSNETANRLTARDLITQAPVTLASRLPLPNEFQLAEPRPDQTAQIALPARSEPSNQPNAPQGTDAHIGPMQIFLSVLAIALALAAILGRVIFRYVTAMRRKQAAQIRRRQIWPDDIPEASAHPSYAQMITPERRARGVRVNEDITEIERLLRGGSRRLR